VYSDEDFRKKLSIWIAVDDQPFTVVECTEFQDVIKACSLQAKIPSADTIRNDIIKIYKDYRETMQIIFQVNEFH
jgi:Leu/Phe-tRNA-protein transferase